MQNNFDIQFKSPSSFRGAFCLFLLFTAFTIYAQPQLKFKDTKKSFGFVKKGEVVTLVYEFTNTGDLPALLTEAKVECSCTSVDFPTHPILPHETEKVIVKFDTKSVYDRQDRIIEIKSNAKNSSQNIRFKGVVLK